VAGPDALDRGAFARLACAEFGLDPTAVTYATTAELGQKAQRPLSAALDTAKLEAAGLSVRGVEAGLRAMREAVEAGGWASFTQS
jgi:dTDP-4-dehydrorhamnose reductase